MLPFGNPVREALSDGFLQADYDLFFARMVESVPQYNEQKRLFFQCYIISYKRFRYWHRILTISGNQNT